MSLKAYTLTGLLIYFADTDLEMHCCESFSFMFVTFSSLNHRATQSKCWMANGNDVCLCIYPSSPYSTQEVPNCSSKLL